MNQPFNPFGNAPAPAPAQQGFPQQQQPTPFVHPGAPQQGFPQQQAPQQQPSVTADSIAGMIAGMGDADPSERLPPLPQGGHEELAVSNIRIFKGLDGVYFGADIEVVTSRNAPTGFRGGYIEKMAPHRYESHQRDAHGRVRSFLCACMGQDFKAPEVRALFNDPAKAQQVIAAAERGQFDGKRIAAPNVTHKLTSKGKTIALYTFAPVGTAVSAAPPPVQAAPQPAAKPWPPAGWQADPTNPGYYRGFFSGQPVQVTEAQLRTAQEAGQV